MNSPRKEELRTKLQRMNHDNHAMVATRVVRELMRILKQLGNVKYVLVYQPIEKWQELDISPLPSFLPSFHFETVESTKNALFPEGKFDVIIVPLFGFNNKGYRLGHGGGWYDRFLATQPEVLKIGVGHEDALIDFEPEPYDVRMDILVTEQQTRDFRVQ